MKTNQFRAASILAALLLTFAALFISGCSTLDKKISKAKILAYQNPQQFADLCATLFPVRDSVVQEGAAIYKPAENKDQSIPIEVLVKTVDSLVDKSKSDSSQNAILHRMELSDLQKQLYSLKNSYQKCKPDTVFMPGKIHYRSNTAAEEALKLKLNNLSTEKTKVDQKLSSTKITRNWSLGANLVLLLGVGFLIFVLAKTK